ncbi:MAG: hypothetical protein ABIS68_09570 [Casimicrobiaceae bacterium]
MSATFRMIRQNDSTTLRNFFAILAWLAAVTIFCAVAGHWIWRALEPRQTATLPGDSANWSSAILSGSALGYTRAEPQGAALAAAPAGPESRVRLMGIAREPRDRSQHAARALFKVDNKRFLWLSVGGEVEPGLSLRAIDADAVRLVRDGKETTLLLREPRPPVARGGTPAIAAAPAAPAPPSARAGDTCKLTADQRNRAYILRPEIIEGVMRERNGWTDLFKPSGIGLLVQNPGGTGAMLGLYGNDILTKADGAQLVELDDVYRLVMQPLARNESVVVSGLRGGQPREWIYASTNCLSR